MKRPGDAGYPGPAIIPVVVGESARGSFWGKANQKGEEEGKGKSRRGTSSD